MTEQQKRSQAFAGIIIIIIGVIISFRPLKLRDGNKGVNQASTKTAKRNLEKTSKLQSTDNGLEDDLNSMGSSSLVPCSRGLDYPDLSL